MTQEEIELKLACDIRKVIAKYWKKYEEIKKDSGGFKNRTIQHIYDYNNELLR